MNKKLFLGMFAAAGMLLATSCSNDELDVVQSGNEAQVTFNLGTEGGIATRAISDGTGADQLYYSVFDKNGNRISTIAQVKRTGLTDLLTGHTETITLAKGQTYQVAFWAQDGDCNAYTVSDDMKVSVNYNGKNNDESRDAFFKTVEFTVTGNTSINVELERPFAQINVGVYEEDWNPAVASGITIKQSEVVLKNAYTQINLLDGSVSGEQEITYSFEDIPAESLSVDLNQDGTKENYKYLSMSYILVDEAKATLEDLEFTFKPESGNNIVFSDGLNAVPIQRNWRTNIIGQILTGNISFNIIVDEEFDGEYNNGNALPVELNGAHYSTIEKALADAVAGDVINLSVGTFTLPNGINLKNNATGTITFAGKGEGTIVNMPGNQWNNNALPGVYATNLNVTFKDMRLNTNNNYMTGAFGAATSVTFDNCNIFGGYHANQDNQFVNCTIDPLSDYIYTYAGNCNFKGCTFSSSKGKALQVYAETSNVNYVIDIKDCTFTAAIVATTSSNPAKPVTAIDINSINNNKFTVNITNSTATGYGVGEFSGSSLWNIKGGYNNVTVVLDGETLPFVTNGATSTVYGNLQKAYDAATTGDVLTLGDGIYNGIFEFDSDKTITLKAANNYEAVINGELGAAGNGTLNLEGLTFQCSDFSKSYSNNHLNRAGAYIISIYVANVNVDNCVFNTTEFETGAINQYAANTTLLSVKNSTFNSNGNYTIRTRANVTVDNCTFDGMVRQCLQVQGNPTYSTSQTTTFTNNKVTNASSGVMGVSISNGFEAKSMTFNVGSNDAIINNISYDEAKASNIIPYLSTHSFTGEVTTIVKESEL